MKCARVFLLVGLSFIFLFSSLVYADVPQMINYQGKVTDEKGHLIDGTVEMIFSIYGNPTDVDPAWAETLSVEVEKGSFSVLLGSVHPIPYNLFDGTVKYLGIKVEDDPEMTPRKEIVSVAYAYRSFETDTANYAKAAPSVPDNDWTFRITDTADTTLITGGVWGIARYGNELYGNADSTHVNLGVACTTGTSGQNYKYCTVAGGFRNAASGYRATVGGGDGNTASGYIATVGGGLWNTASGSWATVGGGRSNTASDAYATVGGGVSNTASGGYATVGGGFVNTASREAATVGGGGNNTASGQYATVLGGFNNTVATNGHHSMIFGQAVYVNSSYRVVFFDGYYSGRLGINRDDNDGGISHPIHVGTNTGNGNGAYLSAGGTWTNASSREVKENFQKINGSEILDKLQSMSISRWKYKATDEYHIGPVSEDFNTAFAIGVDNEHLASSDVSGVALRAIQELITKLEAQQEELDALKAKLEKLESSR